MSQIFSFPLPLNLFLNKLLQYELYMLKIFTNHNCLLTAVLALRSFAYYILGVVLGYNVEEGSVDAGLHQR